jgi:hypothetical protein
VQDTKLDLIDRALVSEIAGPARREFVFLPPDEKRDEAAIFWDASIVALSNVPVLTYSITATITVLHTSTTFLLTTVYGPSTDTDKPAFLQEMTSLKLANNTPWLILGDFNMIYEARDKNNLNLNRRRMREFRSAIHAAELFEMRCSNRRFSWSNQRESPNLVYLDHVLCNVAWDAIFSPCSVQALSSSHSDHCPRCLPASARHRARLASGSRASGQRFL